LSPFVDMFHYWLSTVMTDKVVSRIGSQWGRRQPTLKKVFGTSLEMTNLLDFFEEAFKKEV